MEVISLFAGLCFYLGWCVVNGMIADAKNRGTGTILLISILFTPLLPYLYLIAVPPKELPRS
jgi:hypothetical protein